MFVISFWNLGATKNNKNGGSGRTHQSQLCQMSENLIQIKRLPKNTFIIKF